MYKFKAYGRDITISDEDMRLIEENDSFLNNNACQHYLIAYFIYKLDLDDITKEINKYSDEELSIIVMKMVKEEVFV